MKKPLLKIGDTIYYLSEDRMTVIPREVVSVTELKPDNGLSSDAIYEFKTGDKWSITQYEDSKTAEDMLECVPTFLLIDKIEAYRYARRAAETQISCMNAKIREAERRLAETCKVLKSL